MKTYKIKVFQDYWTVKTKALLRETIDLDIASVTTPKDTHMRLFSTKNIPMPPGVSGISSCALKLSQTRSGSTSRYLQTPCDHMNSVTMRTGKATLQRVKQCSLSSKTTFRKTLQRPQSWKHGRHIPHYHTCCKTSAGAILNLNIWSDWHNLHWLNCVSARTPAFKCWSRENCAIMSHDVQSYAWPHPTASTIVQSCYDADFIKSPLTMHPVLCDGGARIHGLRDQSTAKYSTIFRK